MEENWSHIHASMKAERNSSATKCEEKEREKRDPTKRPLLSFLRWMMRSRMYANLFPPDATPEHVESFLREQISVFTPAQLATKVPTQVYRHLIFTNAAHVPQEKIVSFRSVAYQWNASDEDDDAEDCPACMSAKNTCVLFCDIDERSPPAMHRNGCADCLRMAIENQMKSGKIRCCQQIASHSGSKRCNAIIPDFVLESVFSQSSNEMQAIRKNQTLRFLASQKDVVQCPGPDCCERIVVRTPGRKEIAKCPTCDTSFCTKCKKLPHYRGTTCSEAMQIIASWTRWVSKDRAEFYRKIGMTAKRANDQARRAAQRARDILAQDEAWKGANCRLCPHCDRIVDKIDGCDRVLCGRDCDANVNHQHGCGRHFYFSKAKKYVPAAAKRIPFKPMRAEDLLKPHIVARIDGRGIPFMCSSCHDPIKGPRFQCLHCPSFDICMKCEKQYVEGGGSRQVHSPKHAFKVIYPTDSEDACAAAAPPPSPPSSNMRMRSLCKYFAEGYCRDGARCRYFHNVKRPQSVHAPTNGHWEWRDDSRWKPFEKVHCAQIESAYATKSSVILSPAPGKSYFIDTRSMTQTNARTGFSRPIRRTDFSPPSATMRPLCRYYAKGYCRDGARCRYAHRTTMADGQ